MARARWFGDKRGVTPAPFQTDPLPIDPAAGKTTRVPLALLEAGLTPGRIVMLEPRRLATRAAAERMAATLGEPVGRTVGYRMRGDAKTSRQTRIEVVTEGILTRMLQSDPGLEGVGAVIFDEFHERSLNADLGLALALEVRGALREDLILLAMSATLDAAPVAALMGGVPIVRAEGRSFPVETRWLDTPAPVGERFEVSSSCPAQARSRGWPCSSTAGFRPAASSARCTAPCPSHSSAPPSRLSKAAARSSCRPPSPRPR